MSEYRLEMRGMRKSFPGVQALDDAFLRVAPGEVHCLLGANGAGKSTLIKVLAGAYQLDDGEIFLDGEPVTITSPVDGQRAGISVIYQELDLVPDMTVEQNLLLGHAPRWAGVVRRAERSRRAAEAIRRVGGDVDLKQTVGRLSVVDQQFTAIAKALTFDARVIVMDEPSATLSQNELTELFDVIRSLVSDNQSVIYISHRLDEVFSIGDRATVMRDGRTVAEVDVADTTEQQLVSAMIGHRSGGGIEKVARDVPPADPLLHVERVHVPGLLDVRDLEVLPGEIVGLAGLAGSGRTTFLRALFGVDPSAELSATLGGVPYAPKTPGQAIQAGVGLVPENRKEEGLILNRSVSENLGLASLGNQRIVTPRGLQQLAAPLVETLDIRVSRSEQLVHTLSGGNQQKVVLGKWILKGVRLLLLDEPSRGLDVAAKQSLYDEVRGLADEGHGCLVASSELPELLANCDRIVVFHSGEITQQFDTDRTDHDAIHRAVITGREQAA